MSNRSKNRKWDFKFFDRFERERALKDGYALIRLRPDTPKEELSLVEFEKDGTTPIHKRFPLRYYDTCTEFCVLPSEASLYYVNMPNTTISNKKRNRIKNSKKEVKGIVTSLESFQKIFDDDLISIINNFGQVESEYALSLNGYTLDDLIIKKVEMYILGYDKVSDVEVVENEIKIKF